MAKNQSAESANIDQKVHQAQVQLLYRQTWTGLGGVLIVALTSCVALWQVVPQWKLSLWVGISVLLTVARGCIVFAFQRRALLTSNIDRWAMRHSVGVILSGLMWAAPSIFLWPAENSVYQLVWPILILPLSAAAVAVYYTWTMSYVTFITLAVVPISVRFFIEGGNLFNVLGLLALFFIVVLLRAGRVMNAANARTFEIGFHNEALNVQLQQEIAERKLSENELSRKNQDLVSLNKELTSTKFNLESSNKKLEDAIADIKQLSGMLPICSSCKNIRNDRGYWEVLESYLEVHSDVEFSHGICPDCAKKLYPDIYREK